MLNVLFNQIIKLVSLYTKLIFYKFLLVLKYFLLKLYMNNVCCSKKGLNHQNSILVEKVG